MKLLEMRFEQFVLELSVTIRPCHKEDLSSLEWFGLFRDYRGVIARAFERQEKGEVVMLVAETNGFPIGQVWVDLARKKAESVGKLWAFRVMSPLQNLGIGTRLLRTAEGFLKDKGFATAELGVEKDNPRARQLYERLGYQVVCESIDEYDYTTPNGETIHEVLEGWDMHKSLT